MAMVRKWTLILGFVSVSQNLALALNVVEYRTTNPTQHVVIESDGKISVLVNGKETQGQMRPSELTALKQFIAKIPLVQFGTLNDNIPQDSGFGGVLIAVTNEESDQRISILEASGQILFDQESGIRSAMKIEKNPSAEATRLITHIESLASRYGGLKAKELRAVSEMEASRNIGNLGPDQHRYTMDYPDKLDWKSFDPHQFDPYFYTRDQGLIIGRNHDGWYLQSLSDEPIALVEVGRKLLKPGVVVLEFTYKGAHDEQKTFSIEVDLLNHFAKTSVESINGTKPPKSFVYSFSKLPPGFDGLKFGTVEIRERTALEHAVHPSHRGEVEFFTWWSKNEDSIPSAPKFHDIDTPVRSGQIAEAERRGMPRFGAPRAHVYAPLYVVGAFLKSEAGENWFADGVSYSYGATPAGPSSCAGVLKILSSVSARFTQ